MAVDVIDPKAAARKVGKEKRVGRKKADVAELVQKQYMLRNQLLKHKILIDGRIDLLCTEVLGYSLYKFHKQIMAFQINKKKSLVLAPRDSGKSTILTYTKIIFEILRNQ